MMRFGRKFRVLCVLSCSACVSVGLLGSAGAQQAPQLPVDEDARLALIDHCVLNEGARFGQYDNFADRCKCATSTLMATMSQSEMQAVAKWRKPTTALKKRWQSAWEGCG